MSASYEPPMYVKQKFDWLPVLGLLAFMLFVSGVAGAVYLQRSPVVAVTTKYFEEQIERADVPVLVQFHAEWCQPCRLMHPVVDEVAREFRGRATVAAVDIDRSPGLAQRYQIDVVPTFLVLRRGRVVKEWNGMAEKQQLSDWLVEPGAGE